MSFLKNLTNIVKGGRIPNMNDVTNLAKRSVQENNSPFAPREITDDMLSPAQLQISRMQWDSTQAGQASNKGSANAVKNWEESATDTDLYLTWNAEDQDISEYVVLLAWKGWATALIMRDSPKFQPEYVDAVISDKMSSLRIVRFAAEKAPQNAICFPASDKNRFVYVKLMGLDGSGNYIELRDYTLGSHAKREKDQLASVPEGDLLKIDVPSGSREANDFEKQFAPKM
ncbi:MAG: hypothetical protein WDZ30_03840 [Cellvibrionaceae bacterium]